jgi:UrcA family protein
MFRPTRIILALGIAIAAGSPIAHADEENSNLIASVRVDYRDLNLRDSADARVMLGRLESAAQEACGNDPQAQVFVDVLHSRRVAELYRECREDAVARAVTALNSNALTLAFEAKKGTVRRYAGN